MDLTYQENMKIHDFLVANKAIFEENLLNEAVNVRDKIDEIHYIGNINLLKNAHKLVLLFVDEDVDEVTRFAKQEGVLWAKFSLTLAFKLEWLQAIRRTLWRFLREYDIHSGQIETNDQFYELESRINDLVDLFLNSFFISYSKYKDELIEAQRKMVDNLSVPIIPITPSVCILPLIGTIDTYRASIIEEKVLIEIGKLRIQTLIMDLSGIAEMDHEAIKHFLKLLDAISMMGAKSVITGLRPEIVREMVKLDIDFGSKADTKGSLQMALKDYLNMDIPSDQTISSINLMTQ
ncbi:Anti-anti-sigma regulatory factor (antagonist of anti-sigma factor) [Oceanobacillus limi]|uniref:Anti-anti-sigma regulatory factor (Antagonist of anti-sigma factor) n=2 Tax=Oceanobacillus limi TaxID=930131 RepID=A0A1H9Z3P4_9BACI|nr:Anti-anti-sigma regulatory factor (antagonist of anti-sigma factor) [Oceanobacillus limi]